MTTESRYPLIARYRRALLLGGWIAGVALTVVLFNVTTQKPTRTASDRGPGNAPDSPTLEVGALPVT